MDEETYRARLAVVVREALRLRGQIQDDSADIVGRSRQTVSEWTNLRGPSKAFDLHKLHVLLGIPAELLLDPPDDQLAVKQRLAEWHRDQLASR